MAGPGQRDHYTARRAEIWESLYPAEPSRDYSLPSADEEREEQQPRQIVAPVAKHGHAQTKGFAASTAEVTGENVRQIQRSLARGQALGPDALRVVGTSLDKGVELTALAKMQPEQRAPLIARAVAGEKVTARAPAPPPAAPPPSLALRVGGPSYRRVQCPRGLYVSAVSFTGDGVSLILRNALQ